MPPCRPGTTATARTASSGTASRTPAPATAALTADGGTDGARDLERRDRVADWRVLAGPGPLVARPVAVAAWNGLDTTITIGGSPAVVQVVALDDRGRTIRSSTPTAAA